MSDKKQTAVEWLVKTLNDRIDFIPINKWDLIRDIIQQAKQMEKEQIIKAHKDGNKYNNWGLEHEHEQYYNEIYNTNQ